MKKRQRNYADRLPLQSAGFTLLEVMIALLVLSIGLLGLAGLQAAGTRLGYDAHIRSITTLVSSEIIDQIRMRTAGYPSEQRQSVIAQYETTAPADTCNPTAGAVPDELACWQRRINDNLPGGVGNIVDNADGSVSISVSWDDRETGETYSLNWNFIAGNINP